MQDLVWATIEPVGWPLLVILLVALFFKPNVRPRIRASTTRPRIGRLKRAHVAWKTARQKRRHKWRDYAKGGERTGYDAGEIR